MEVNHDSDMLSTMSKSIELNKSPVVSTSKNYSLTETEQVNCEVVQSKSNQSGINLVGLFTVSEAATRGSESSPETRQDNDVPLSTAADIVMCENISSKSFARLSNRVGGLLHRSNNRDIAATNTKAYTAEKNVTNQKKSSDVTSKTIPSDCSDETTDRNGNFVTGLFQPNQTSDPAQTRLEVPVSPRGIARDGTRMRGVFQRNYISTDQRETNHTKPINSGNSSRMSGASQLFGLRRNKNPFSKDTSMVDMEQVIADSSIVDDFSSNKNKLPCQIKVVYHEFGPNADQILKIEQEPVPSVLVNPNHVLVKVQASTITLNDCLLRRGFDFEVWSPASLPIIPGSDVVGTIVAVGDRCCQIVPKGTRVAALVRTGGNARYVSVPESSLIPIPNTLESGEAAALISIHMTAYYCLKAIAKKDHGISLMYALAGKKVLILGGNDGVGRALVQLCRKAHAEIYVLAPAHRHIYVKNILGSTPLSENDDWLTTVEGQIDYVFDGTCEQNSQRAFRAMNATGKLVCYGCAALLQHGEQQGLLGAPLSAHWNNLTNSLSTRIYHVDVWKHFQRDPVGFKNDLQTVVQSLRWNKIDPPHISKRVSLAGVAAAQAKLEANDLRGIVVCFPWRPLRSNKVSARTQNETTKSEV